MPINSRVINSGAINAPASIVTWGTFSGTISLFSQNCTVQTTSINLITLYQGVQLQSSHIAFNIITFNQQTTSVSTAHNIIEFKQRVELTHSFYDKNGYDVQVIVGDFLVLTTSLGKNQNGLCDTLSVNMSTNSQRTATFSFIPPEDVVDLEQYQGQEVIITVKTGATFEPIFTGIVTTPKIDFIARKISLACTDNRQQKILALPTQLIETIGLYNESIQGVPQDNAQMLSTRMTTVLADFNFDRFGKPKLSDWLPKSTPDHTIVSSDVWYNENPTLEYSSREQTVNTINLVFDYTYQRLHQQVVGVVWPGYSQFSTDYYNQGQPSFPPRSNIISAAQGGNWKLINQTNGEPLINFTALWPAQGYPTESGVVIWQPDQVVHEYKGKVMLAGWVKDSTGNFVYAGTPPQLVPLYNPVLDAQGKQVMDIVKTTITHTSAALCRGASWGAGLHFSQTVTEEYNLCLKAPQSIDKYGEVEQTQKYSITDPYDTSSWVGNVTQLYDNFYIDQKVNYGNFRNALQVALKKAQHDILEKQRDCKLGWRFVTLNPTVDLCDTIDFTVDQSALGSSASIRAVGVVDSISHNVDFNSLEGYTRASLKLSRALGSSPATTEWVITQPIEDPSYIGSPQTLSLGTHLGQDITTAFPPDQQNTWTGWVGNRNFTVADPGSISGGVNGNGSGTTTRTNFTEQFIVSYPAIPGNVRNPITYGGQVCTVTEPSDAGAISTGTTPELAITAAIDNMKILHPGTYPTGYDSAFYDTLVVDDAANTFTYTWYQGVDGFTLLPGPANYASGTIQPAGQTPIEIAVPNDVLEISF